MGLARKVAAIGVIGWGATTSCAEPTVIDVSVYSEVPCATHADLALSVGPDAPSLDHALISATAIQCSDAGDGTVRRGSVVLTPEGNNEKTIAFQLETRNDDQPLEACVADRAHCIVARRQLRFLPHQTIKVRVDMRLSCLGVVCAPDQTCLKGGCVKAQLPDCTDCGEGSLGGTTAALPDAGVDDAAQEAGTDAAPNVGGDTSGLLVGAPWPLIYGTPTNSGRSLALGPATGATALGPITTDNTSEQQGTVGPGNKVYLSEFNTGNVYAYDYVTGTRVWPATTSGLSLEGSPALANDGLLYVATSYGQIIAFDQATGVRKWPLQLNGSFSAPIMGPPGVVYFGAKSPWGFYAVDTVTHGQKWHFNVPNSGDANTAPALGPTRVYFVDGKNSHLFAIDTTSGSQAFDVPVPGAALGSPVLGVNAVYVATKAAGIVSFDPISGAQGWTYPQSLAVVQPALLANGNLVSSANDGTGFVLDYKTGTLVTPIAIGAGPSTSPIVDAADNVYFATSAGASSFVGATGALRWQSPLFGRLIMGDGKLLVVTTSTFAVIGP